MIEQSATALKCYHCGQVCEDTFWIEDKSFCCYGCKTIFEILQENNLCEYYNFEAAPGIRGETPADSHAYLDDSEIRKKVIEFDSAEFSRVRFTIPAIHCSSCIWLLEQLERLHTGIIKSEINFSHKSVSIDFNPIQIKLSAIVSLLDKIGYPPQITLDEKKEKAAGNKSLLIKLAIAGFSFGNIMLFSFPEYLGLSQSDHVLMRTFSWLNLVLAIPVFVYCASDYFRSALASFRQREINIDFPIALGLLALFSRSVFDIVTASGSGYLDSFAGLVFFLLIGRWFQGKTYETLAFDRDFKSYFPLAVHKIINATRQPVVIYELNAGDRIWIRNMEIVPADSILLDNKAYIDYSFVTGESKPVKVLQDERIYAGGRVIGQPVILQVEKQTSQSHLTSLWNHEAFRKTNESRYKKIIDQAARKFTWIVMGIALLTSIYWYVMAPASMWLVITSVLMVACPCALALAAPFTYGSMLRALGQHQLYLKNADVIERLARIDAVVFDKTGTITVGQNPEVKFNGDLDDEQLGWVKILTGYSTHPLSSLVNKYLPETKHQAVADFKEIPGKGIQGTLNGHVIRIGSAQFVEALPVRSINASLIFVSVDNEVKGYFSIATPIRKNMEKMLQRLNTKCVAVLSGDNDSEKEKIRALFPSATELHFNQSPHEKLEFIRGLQARGRKVLMIGDGLNDAGALKQSDVGIAVTDNTATFTPACDGILHGDQVNALDRFLDLAKLSTTILKIAFVLSFMYNAIALSFAVTGLLTPLVAAVLMPLSSISVVVFSSMAVRYVTYRKMNQKKLSLHYKINLSWKSTFQAKKP